MSRLRGSGREPDAPAVSLVNRIRGRRAERYQGQRRTGVRLALRSCRREGAYDYNPSHEGRYPASR
jgi:hypothetical protein